MKEAVMARDQYWSRQHIEHDGAYDKKKKELFIAFLQQFDKEKGLGDILIDLGCGPNPLSRQFPDRPAIEVDVSKKRTQKKERLGLLEVAGDVEKIFTDDGEEKTEAEKQILSFIKEVEAKSGTVIISDLLNYIDWKRLFVKMDRLLPEGWQVAINNRVNYGPEEALNDERPQSKEDIKDFFTHELGYELLEEGFLPPLPEENDNEPHTWFIYKKPVS